SMAWAWLRFYSQERIFEALAAGAAGNGVDTDGAEHRVAVCHFDDLWTNAWAGSRAPRASAGRLRAPSA
ncbi:MAG: hypothetical protein M3Y67_07285, partial [Pseudomonadota bacterium]|nr:hypothetical protein [Pseudomonadota bacterium]